LTPRVLFIDDFYGDFEDGLKQRFGVDNVHCLRYPNAREALRIIRTAGISAVLLDIQFERDDHDRVITPAVNVGHKLLHAIKRAYPDLPVFMLTSYARTIDPADFGLDDGRQQKPDPEASGEEYAEFYDTLFKEVSLSVRLAATRDWDAEMGFVVGSNPAMVEVARKIMRWVHLGERFFLVTGEYGTGKEQVGRALHLLFGYSDRDESYQAMLCHAVSPRDFRINLGGFPKQAGSEAARGHLAPLEDLGWRGTMFFDQIDDLGEDSQLVLNRMLEGQGFPQENNPGKVFFPECKIAFTAQLPPEQLQERMRGDSFQRCFRNHVHLPPLRERKDTIPALFEDFVRVATQGRHFDSFLRDDVKEKLVSYDFPGNIRELKHMVERAIAKTRNSPLQADDIEIPHRAPETSLSQPEGQAAEAELRRLLDDAEAVRSQFAANPGGYPKDPEDYVPGKKSGTKSRVRGRDYTIDETRYPRRVIESLIARDPEVSGKKLAFTLGKSERATRKLMSDLGISLRERRTQ